MRKKRERNSILEHDTGKLDAAVTRRDLLRRTGLLAGIGLSALLAGCSRGDDDDSEFENSGLDEGAEDPGEDPGIETETGIESGPEGAAETEEEGLDGEESD